ncbi:putative sterol desaturase [Emiliania huxleyi virus 86]|uniref:Putative sterol desaturase n=1 Tax=Emiliania huxleyi virus 86 (isolate United Kingdom/English Channel/1999) TaxID=654925 RepID=Q4A3A3_EHV8U|nr:putative sterol desaturase [Emiliania huxleyi virus 86]AEO97842.1 hypothetical protein ENVG_00145 [Emiliania huxleyi virus 84]AEP14968.1 hypothetical protein EOVG_00031 [Emiliania huxleyi virus 88]AHA54590.1 putative sterol desaturase [Emiliania huxleyi virus 145]AHA55631.1 putative sterol desaturase [Emiliania huxleyi virus 164]CAI65454.1 putative sterol desaturase [Emiliania huxleyi virus 86]
MFRWRTYDTFDLIINIIGFSAIFMYKKSADGFDNTLLEYITGGIGFYILDTTMGKSPFAWFIACMSYMTTEQQWITFKLWLTSYISNEIFAYTIAASIAFTATYSLHGMYLLFFSHVLGDNQRAKLHVKKVQENKHVPFEKIMDALPTMFKNLLTLAYPFMGIIVLYSFKTTNGLRFDKLPTFTERFWSLLSVILTNEVLFYYSHRALHHPKLYAKFHKKHHEFTSPVGAVAIYCTQIEFLVSDLLPLGVGLLFPYAAHAHFALTWIIAANIATQVHHSGMHMPYALGIDEQPTYHDLHHKHFNYNYGAIGILDKIHGTEYITKDVIS